MIDYDYDKKFGIDRPMFGGLMAIEVIRDLIGEGIFSILQEIAKVDENTKKIMEHISSLPDMTEKDVENQVIKLAKLEIEMAGGPKVGFENWLRIQESIYDQRKEYWSLVQKDNHQRIVDHLTNWAIENGYENHGKKEKRRKEYDEKKD